MPKVLSLDKSLLVLEAIFQYREGIGTRALAAKLEINVASVHNIAQTFCQRGYLWQDPKTKAFHPGIRIMLLGRHPSYLRSLSNAAADIVNAVAESLNESVMLSTINHGRVLNLKYVPCTQALRVQEDEDISDRSYATGVGKVLLAALEDSEFESYLHETELLQLTPQTFATPERLRQELKKVREQGFAQTCDEYDEGVSAVAVPIFDPWNRVVASIGASAPTVRLESKSQINATLEELRKAACAIEKQWTENGHRSS